MSTCFRYLLLVLVLLQTAPLLAQTGLHFVFLSYDGFSQRGSNCMAVGVDRDVNEHSSISLEAQFGFRLFDKESMQYQYGYYQGTGLNYTMSTGFTGLHYRSSYLFKDADDATPYISVLVGVRSARMAVSNVDVSGLYSNDPIPNWARDVTETMLVFPVGLRFGYRSPLDGYTGDIYFGIAQQLGKDLWATPYLQDKDQLAGLTLHVGYAFGVGW